MRRSILPEKQPTRTGTPVLYTAPWPLEYVQPDSFWAEHLIAQQFEKLGFVAGQPIFAFQCGICSVDDGSQRAQSLVVAPQPMDKRGIGTQPVERRDGGDFFGNEPCRAAVPRSERA